MNINELLYNILSRYYHDIINKYIEILRLFFQGKTNKVKELCDQLVKLINELNERVTKTMEYILRVYHTLDISDIYQNIINNLNDMLNTLELSLLKIKTLVSLNVQTVKNYFEALSGINQLLDIVFNSGSALRKAMMMIFVNPNKTIDECRKIYDYKQEFMNTLNSLYYEVYNKFLTNHINLCILDDLLGMLKNIMS